MKAFLYGLLCCGLTLFFTGCGGSGGVSVAIGTTPPVDPPEITFQSWSSIVFPTEVTIGALSQETAYSTNDEPPPEFFFDDKGVATTTYVTIEYDMAGDVQAVDIQTPETSLVWDVFNGDLINDLNKRAILSQSDGTFVGAFVQPQFIGVDWEYQTFGVWETDRGLGAGSIGGVSMGAPTADIVDSAIPTTGEFDFTGETMGIYVDGGGNDFLTYSTLTVRVNFEDLRNIVLRSENTFAIPVDDLPGESIGSSIESLDFSGSLVYDDVTSTFYGDVLGDGLEGTSTGQFYGPSAEELGGVFKLDSIVDDGFYTGSYGASR